MALFRFLWLRRFIRKNTNPIPIDRAERIKKRLSLLYMLLGWNAFGLVMYMAFTGKADWAKYYGIKSAEEINMPPGQAWAKTLGIENAKVVRYSGFRNKGEYTIVDGEIKTEQES